MSGSSFMGLNQGNEMKTLVVDGLSELPEAYQIGCKVIEGRCIELLQAEKINYDKVHWSKTDLHNCILVVIVANKKHSIKFGMKALVDQQEEGTLQTIMVRLKSLVREIKFEEWLKN